MHNEEIHQGNVQKVLMRTLVTPLTALERQVWESVSIDRLSTSPGSCLNMKSEWGLSQTPHLQAKPNKPGNKPKDEGRKGKRPQRRDLEGVGEEEDTLKPPQNKRMRDKSPEKEENNKTETKEVKETPSNGKETAVKECNPNTPVREKVRRIHQKEASLKNEESKAMGPKGKKKETMKQPTLASFMSARGGLVGPQNQGKCRSTTSCTSFNQATGQGLPGGAKQASSEEFGVIGESRQRTLLPGSPEHNLLTEAQAIKPGNGRRPGKEEAVLRNDSGHCRSGKKPQ